MKKKGFVVAVALIVTFILTIILCAVIAAKQLPANIPNTESATAMAMCRLTKNI